MKSTNSRLLALLVLTLGTVSFAQVAQAQTAAFTPPASPTTSGSNGVTMGYTFTVGASPISVTDLGFYDAGLNGLVSSHIISIWDGGGTKLGTATVASGTTAPLTGDYRYVSLGAGSITLSANTIYTIGAAFPFATPEQGPIQISAGTVTASSGVTLGAPRYTFGEDVFTTTDATGLETV